MKTKSILVSLLIGSTLLLGACNQDKYSYKTQEGTFIAREDMERISESMNTTDTCGGYTSINLIMLNEVDFFATDYRNHLQMGTEGKKRYRDMEENLLNELERVETKFVLTTDKDKDINYLYLQWKGKMLHGIELVNQYIDTTDEAQKEKLLEEANMVMKDAKDYSTYLFMESNNVCEETK